MSKIPKDMEFVHIDTTPKNREMPNSEKPQATSNPRHVRLSKEEKRQYKEKSNEMIIPYGLRVIDKEDMNHAEAKIKAEIGEKRAKASVLALVFGIISVILACFIIANMVWLNISVKDGKFQSNIPVNVKSSDLYLNITNPINCNTNVTIINQIGQGTQYCPITYPNNFSNIIITNATIINSTILNSTIINSSVNA